MSLLGDFVKIQKENKVLKERIETDFATIKKFQEKALDTAHRNGEFAKEFRNLKSQLEKQTKILDKIKELSNSGRICRTQLGFDLMCIEIKELKAILEKIEK